MPAGSKSTATWTLPLAVLILAAAIFALNPVGLASRFWSWEYDLYRHFQPVGSHMAGFVLPVLYLAVAGLVLIVILMRGGALWAGVFTVVAIVAALGLGWCSYIHAHLTIGALGASAGLALAYGAGAVALAVARAQTRAALRESFAGIVGAQSIDEIARDPSQIKASGEARIVTCLSCRLRDPSESHTAFTVGASDVMHKYGAAMRAMIDVVLDMNGTVASMGGDMFTACWNAPLSDADAVPHACAAALRMMTALAQSGANPTQARRFDASPEPALQAEIGIAMGPVIAGMFEAQSRNAYAVYGDCAVEAETLRGLSRLYGYPIVVSDAVRVSAERNAAFLEIDAIQPRDEPVKLFALLGDLAMRASPKFRALATFHEHIFRALRARQWEKARELIGHARALSGANQTLYVLHLNRIDWLEHHPPGADWDGVFVPPVT